MFYDQQWGGPLQSNGLGITIHHCNFERCYFTGNELAAVGDDLLIEHTCRLQALHDLPLDWPSQRQILGFAPAVQVSKSSW